MILLINVSDLQVIQQVFLSNRRAHEKSCYPRVLLPNTLLSVFGFEGWNWVLIASVLDHCILFTFLHHEITKCRQYFGGNVSIVKCLSDGYYRSGYFIKGKNRLNNSVSKVVSLV